MPPTNRRDASVRFRLPSPDMTRRPSPALILWLLFIVLSITWGSSYFFIKVGVEEGLQPFTLIAWRLGIAIAALLALLALTRSRLPPPAIVCGGPARRAEPITVNRVVGLVVGFAGAVILLGRHLAPTAGSDPN